MPVLTSPPLIGGAGKPVTGRVAVSSTHDFEWTDSLGVVRYITQAVQQGVVRDGQFFALDSSDPIELIPTPANVGMRIVLRLDEQGASRGEHVTSRTVTVPSGATVAWGALVDVVPPVSGGDYVIPPWASDVITYRDQAGVSATNAASSATAAQTSATNAASSATAASGSASSAATSATNAAASAAAAAAPTETQIGTSLSATDANAGRLGALRLVQASDVAGPIPALRRLRDALLARATTPVRVCFYGDSITAGANAGRDTRFTETFVQELRRLHPTNGGDTGGRGFLSVNANNYSPAVVAGTTVIQGGANAYSPDHSTVRLDTAGRTITYPINGTGADILYTVYPGGGSFYWKVDGGTATVVNTNGTGTGVTSRAMIRGLTPGAHTIEVGHSVDGVTIIAGLVEYNGDENAGIVSVAAGVGGTTTAFWVGNSGRHFDHLPLYEPPLVVIGLGTNDYYHSTGHITPAAYRTNLESMIASVKEHTTVDPSIVLLTPTVTNAASPLAPWGDYKLVQHAIAAADPNNVCVFDWGFRVNPTGTATTAAGLIHSDLVHPTVAGHDFIGKALARFVGVV